VVEALSPFGRVAYWLRLLPSALALFFVYRASQQRRVKVAMKLISMKRPMTALRAGARPLVAVSVVEWRLLAKLMNWLA
jgi:hypothetical protein